MEKEGKRMKKIIFSLLLILSLSILFLPVGLAYTTRNSQRKGPEVGSVKETTPSRAQTLNALHRASETVNRRSSATPAVEKKAVTATKSSMRANMLSKAKRAIRRNKEITSVHKTGAPTKPPAEQTKVTTQATTNPRQRTPNRQSQTQTSGPNFQINIGPTGTTIGASMGVNMGGCSVQGQASQHFPRQQ
jgi:hypothetical protein